MVGECCQEEWKTKAWRGLAKFFMLGSYLQDTSVGFFPQEKVLLPDPGQSSFKFSQGGAELGVEDGQDARRTMLDVPQFQEPPPSAPLQGCQRLQQRQDLIRQGNPPNQRLRQLLQDRAASPSPARGCPTAHLCPDHQQRLLAGLCPAPGGGQEDQDLEEPPGHRPAHVPPPGPARALPPSLRG